MGSSVSPPVEIERRFLVRADRLPRRLPTGDRLVQGYLGFAPTVRVRLVTPPRGGPRGYLAIKGPGTRRRQEFEYPVPVAHARALLRLCGRFVIRKTRYRLGRWELDRYAGLLRGLWLAELEQGRGERALPRPLPGWLGREVTGDPRYTAAHLARLQVRPRWLGR